MPKKKVCIIPNCQSTSSNCELSFFEIPSEERIRQQWLLVLGSLKEKNWIPKDRDMVCSKHFLPEDFGGTAKKKRLKMNVLPSVFSNYPDIILPIYKKNPEESQIEKFPVVENPIASSAICRLCGLNKSQFTEIFENEGFEYDIPKLIQIYLPIEINKNDPVCRYICYECFSALITWHQIFQQIVKVDQNLKLISENNNDCPEIDAASEIFLVNSETQYDVISNTFEEQDNFLNSANISEKVALVNQEKENVFYEDHTTVEKFSTDVSQKNETLLLTNYEKKLENSMIRLYQCNLCDQISKTSEEFKKHLSTHKLIKSYNCSICGETFNQRKLTEQHIRSTHSITGHGTKIRKKENIHKNRKVCSFCNKTLSSFSKLQIHLKTIHCDGSSYVCDVCEKRFPTETEFQDHINATNHRNDGTMIQCSICGLEFENRNCYRKHVAAKHGDGVQCEMCNAVLRNYEDLQEHEALHPRIRPYKCEYCGKNFKRSADYKKHEVIHTGEMPFICEVCGKKFNRKYNMQEHRRKHYGDKPFACEICGLSFFRLGSMRKHKKLHYIKSST